MNPLLLALATVGFVACGRTVFRLAPERRAGGSVLDALTRMAISALLALLFLAAGVGQGYPGAFAGVSRAVIVVGAALCILALIKGARTKEVQMLLGELRRLPRAAMRSWQELRVVEVDDRPQVRALRSSPRWMTVALLVAVTMVSLFVGFGLREGPSWELIRVLAGMWLVSMLVGMGAPVLLAWALVALVSNRLGAMRLLKVVADAAGVGLAVGVVLGIVAVSMEFSGLFSVGGDLGERTDMSANSIFALSTAGAILGALFGFLRSASYLYRHFSSPRLGIVVAVVLPTLCVFLLGLTMSPEAIARRLVDDALVGVPGLCTESAVETHGVVAALHCDGNVGLLYGALPSGGTLAIIVGAALLVFGVLHVYNGAHVAPAPQAPVARAPEPAR
ncbi:hypothetical protein [Sanguibacter sp. 25GB23B1]|uniref:hypothetical protein n=1 Tax=unclassified Sanguibacter TaxID=2645534 RepID=UPI0032B00E0D